MAVPEGLQYVLVLLNVAENPKLEVLFASVSAPKTILNNQLEDRQNVRELVPSMNDERQLALNGESYRKQITKK